MTADEYLTEVLKSQELDPNGPELKTLREQREKVETILRSEFSNCSPTIRYGGSKAKGTMIKESFDLDIICYFPHDDTSAGESLEDIYNNVYNALVDEYLVERKGSALRLKDKNPDTYGVDFHIDVVPGRYIDGDSGDVFLYRSTGEKKRLKTNLTVHIEHVKNSGVIDAIRLMKLWRVRNAIPIKNFVLELLTIDLLKSWKDDSVSVQLSHVWEEFRDNSDTLYVEDPANPSGNDLSDLLDLNVRSTLKTIADATLQSVESHGWESVFGSTESLNKDEKLEALRRITISMPQAPKPWNYG